MGSRNSRGNTEAEKAASSLFGRGARSGQGAHGQVNPTRGDLIKRDDREKEALEKLAPRFPLSSNPSQHIGAGNEHKVELSQNGLHVLKFTKPGTYGFVMHGHAAPFGHYIELRRATPGEYVERIKLHNEVFGTDNRIEGFETREGHAPGIVSSQSFLQGIKVSNEEVAAKMEKAGFSRVNANNIFGDYSSDKTWFNGKTGIMVADVKPDNFIKIGKKIVPFDLIVQRPQQGSYLDLALREGIKKRRT